MKSEGPTDRFWTIRLPSEAVLKEKGSRFLAYAFPVSSEQAIQARLTELKERYPDANHHCYAWRIAAGNRSRTADDREPNRTAGVPIMSQIRSHDLYDVLVVVVRYFGGVKLGTGGLARAYRTAASLVLENTDRVEHQILDEVTLVYTYPATPFVQRLIKEFTLEVRSQDFGEQCRLTAGVRSGIRDELVRRVEGSGVPVEVRIN